MKNTMQYRTMPMTGDKLSVLGYGCMRFPTKNAVIDEAKTEKQVILAIEQGVNYFDTAYIYPNSERVLGKILAKGYREMVKIATKLPIPIVKTTEDINRIFSEQLNRLQTHYIDYYLIHNINTFEEWEKLKTLGIENFIEDERNKGRIINIGFSFHGNLSVFKQIADDYSWDFCQIQYNYMDENYQAGTEGLKYAHGKGLGIIVMEPLRGGTLVGKMPPGAKKVIESHNPKRSPADWGLRWVLNHPEVTLLLSGMNEEEHIRENIRVASEALPNSLTDRDLQMIDKVKDEFKRKIKVPCTGCAYCLPCPQGVDIPFSFSMYNGKSMFGGIFPIYQYLSATGGAKGRLSRASLCKSCGVCERHCPQHLPISKHLKEVASDMEKPHYKFLISLIHRFVYRKR